MSLLGFEVLEYVGIAKDNWIMTVIDKWYYVFAVVGGCKSWRAASMCVCVCVCTCPPVIPESYCES